MASAFRIFDDMTRSIVYKIMVLLLVCGSAISVTQAQHSLPYNFSKPDAVWELPDTLREISGITHLEGDAFACIQDENGIVFIYDVGAKRLTDQFRFEPDGDYEGITRVGNTLFILRSDGELFEIENYRQSSASVHSYTTGIPADNNEGLCYDAVHHRLLIACKGKLGKGPAYKDKRAIYGFDLRKKTLGDEPVLQFDVQQIKQFVVDQQIVTATKSKKKTETAEPFIRFATSAICIHPVTKELYLLSAADHLLFVFHSNGKLTHIEALGPSRFNKSEGIAFFDNGDMLITNEGQDKKPTMFRLNYRP